MNRRDFVFSGAAVSAAALTALALPALNANASGATPVALYKVVYDTRFAASREFGAAAGVAGARPAGFRGDITALWMHDIGPRWAQGSGALAIAGMTTPQALFCLEHLARDYRLRVIVRAEHEASGTGGVDHRVAAHATALEATCPALNNVDWPAALAGRLLVCPPRRANAAVAHASLSATNGRPIDSPLVSWIISG